MKSIVKNRNLLLFVLSLLFCVSIVACVGFATVNAEATPKTLEEVALTMEEGASIRTNEPNGIRFRSFMSVADYEGLKANVGEGKAYKSAYFGMLIAPEDYLTTIGALNEENVFGEDAKYSYGDTAEEGKTRIINVWSSEMNDFNGQKFFAGIITDVLGTNYNRKFVAQGYIKVTATDDTVSYKFAPAADNHRSVISVAQAAIANGDTSEAVQGFVKNADLAGLVTSVENGDKTAANAVDYKEGVISANAGKDGNLYIRLSREVISEKGAGCEYLRLYIKSNTLASFGIIPRKSDGTEDWGYFRTMLTTTGYRDADNNSCAYKDIPLNDASVHDFSKYDLTLWVAGANQNVTITKVEYIKVPTLEETALTTSAWDSYDGTTYTENADGTFTARGWQFGLSASYMQSAIEAGYTHLKLDYTLVNYSGDQSDAAICTEISGGSYTKVYTGTSGSLRFDLANATDGSSYRKVWMQGRKATSHDNAIDVALTVTSARLYKSEETASWTKSNTSIYCAEEDGFIVLDTIYCGNNANVLSSEAFCAKYFNNSVTKDTASQNTVMLMGRYLVAGSNTRGMVWGDASAAVHVVGGTANTDFVIEYLNNRNDYAAGNKFYMGLDKEGVYQLKVIDYVSNRNSWGGFSYTYVDENTFMATILAAQKLVYVEKIQDLIDAGYTKVVITAGEYSSDGQLWVGSGFGSGFMHGLNSGETKEFDLTSFDTSACEWLVIHNAKEKDCQTISDVTISIRFF